MSFNIFANPRFLPLLLACVVLLKLPTLGNGFFADDFIHRSYFVESPRLVAIDPDFEISRKQWHHPFLNLFSFKDPTLHKGHLSPLKVYGAVPWWADETAVLRFFRPLTVMTHWLDWNAWPDNAWMMNFHNLLWYVVVLYLLSKLYCQLSPERSVAMLALALFALDVSHGAVVGWIAGRSSMIALTMTCLALLAQHRFAQTSSRAFYCIAIISFAGSLLAAEAGVATLGYLVAYTLVLDTRSGIKRFFTILPFVLVLLAWRVGYSALGYGAQDVGAYIDPGKNSVQFIISALHNFPNIIFAHFTGLDILAPFVATHTEIALSIVAVVVMLLFFVWFVPLLKVSANARFWALGSLLSIIPICALAKPEARVMLTVSMGAMVVLAQRILMSIRAAALSVQQVDFATRFDRVMRHTSLILNFYIAAFLMLATAAYYIYAGPITPSGEQLDDTIAVAAASELGGKHLVVVNAPSPLPFVYLPFKLDARELPLPTTMRVLAPAYMSLSVTRINEQTLKLSAPGGFPITPNAVADLSKSAVSPIAEKPTPRFNAVYYEQVLIGLFRGDSPLRELQFDFPEMTIRVADSKKGIPQSIYVDLNQQLNRNDFLWVYWSWQKKKYEKFSLPPEGETVVLKGPFD